MRTLADKILHPSHIKRAIFFVSIDAFLIIASLMLAFFVRFEFTIAQSYVEMIQTVLPLFLGAKLVMFVFFKLYRMTWRFVGIRDLRNILLALFVSEAIIMSLVLVPAPAYTPHIEFLEIAGFPRSIFLLDGLISFCLIAGMRLSKRIYLDAVGNTKRVKQGARTIIVGAGSSGEMILRDILKQEDSPFNPVVLLDDDPFKQRHYLHGVQVKGRVADMKAAIAEHRAVALIIAIPNLNHKVLKTIYALAKESGIKTIKIVPRIYDIHQPNINLKGLEEIKIEDLLGRPDVKIDSDEVAGFIRDKVVLVTGAGGSIGSELAMQIRAFHPRRLVLLDADETEMHAMELKLRRNMHGGCASAGASPDLFCVVGDIRDRDLLDSLFRTMKPDIVFHAAAYKHVPIMEYHPYEAVKVNIFGTYNLAEASVNHGVAKFIMISTDKAVLPTSVMGATKRMAEYVCKSFNSRKLTDFVSVRFGNVLGSRGSVLPIFLRQLKQGGPLTVTHRDMRRYFMTIHEAVLLVLQASVIGSDGQVMVLDMGEPVKIVDMAEELIRMHGMEPYKDIDIEFTGMRPGEKLFEEILTAEEGTLSSRHDKVFVAKDSKNYSIDDLDLVLAEFREDVRSASFDPDGRDIRALLRKHIQHYNHASRQDEKPAPLRKRS